MRIALGLVAVVLATAIVGCNKSGGPVVVTPEMEAEQRQAEKDVRDAETNMRKNQKGPTGKPTAEDEEAARRKQGKRE